MEQAITGKITDISRALHVISGLLKGFAADQKISPKEIIELRDWLNNHKNQLDVSPFSDLYDFIQEATETGEIDSGVHDELLDFCEMWESGSGPIDVITRQIRTLHGFLHGIAADGVVDDKEVACLINWIEDNSYCHEHWPFNELKSMLSRILEDGFVDNDERQELLDFCVLFAEKKADSTWDRHDAALPNTSWAKTEAPTLQTIQDICKNSPEIEFPNKAFCFTGKLKAGKRADMHKLVVEQNGIIKKGVVTTLNFLVIGAASNPLWAYSTYGRKIEKAISIQEKGYPLQIVQESDFLNALP
ncbi:BRCT domain-containing protein [Planctomycetota bacterium]